MSPLSNPKRRSEMLGLRSAPRQLVMSCAIITLILLTASLLSAQTPTASVEKAAVEPSAALPDSASKIPVTPIATTKDEPPATPVEIETEPATANTAAPVQIVPCPPGARAIKADVVAIPKAIMLNRLGATIPNAFVFALRGDTTGAGNNIQLRPGKRPRPIVLRANVGDCLRVTFTNAIPLASFANATPESPAVGTTKVSLHIQGQEWASGSGDDGSFV